MKGLCWLLPYLVKGGQTRTFIPFKKRDKNTHCIVPKRAGHSHLDWPGGGSCHRQCGPGTVSTKFNTSLSYKEFLKFLKFFSISQYFSISPKDILFCPLYCQVRVDYCQRSRKLCPPQHCCSSGQTGLEVRPEGQL